MAKENIKIQFEELSNTTSISEMSYGACCPPPDDGSCGGSCGGDCW